MGECMLFGNKCKKLFSCKNWKFRYRVCAIQKPYIWNGIWRHLYICFWETSNLYEKYTYKMVLVLKKNGTFSKYLMSSIVYSPINNDLHRTTMHSCGTTWIRAVQYAALFQCCSPVLLELFMINVGMIYMYPLTMRTALTYDTCVGMIIVQTISIHFNFIRKKRINRKATWLPVMFLLYSPMYIQC